MRKLIAALILLPAIAQAGPNDARECMSPQMRTHYLDLMGWIEAQQGAGASERQALIAARERFDGSEYSAVQQGIAALYGPYGYGPSMVAHVMQLACYEHMRH